MTGEACLNRLCGIAPRVTAIIGGGGKTTLMGRLGLALHEKGKRVVLTTTTHIENRPDAVVPAAVEELNAALDRAEAPVCAGYPQSERKMTGLPEAWYPEIRADHILVEADGSRRHPLKWHRDYEPAVPEGTELLLFVVGLSALGRPLGETLHCQSESGYAADRIADEEVVSRLVLRGLKKTGYTGKTFVVCNQADTEELQRRGERIAELLEREKISCIVTRLKTDTMGFRSE